ncbi:MAG: hypothetical protein DSY59_01190 [Persephonella sp.]|nr:MAG: hypothetical protein DSY59_01190 [Persephonella sp.]
MNLTLKPGEWLVEVRKEGYTSWQKKVSLKEGVVVSLNARLFPKNPSLKPLTSVGVAKAVRVDDLDKVLLFIKKGEKEDGVYLFEKTKNPIASKGKPKKLFSFSKYTQKEIDLDALDPIFSPDFKQFVLEFEGRKYLFSLIPNQEEVLDVTFSYKELFSAHQQTHALRYSLKYDESF